MEKANPRVQTGLLFVLATAMAAPAAAQGIFKCVEAGATAYQSVPCASGQLEARMTLGAEQPRPAVPTAAQSLPTSRQPFPAKSPWRRTTLTLGMSDDEVLNLPGWGRPGRISRSRNSGERREEWVYGHSASGERHLHFANATLVRIITMPPGEHLARLTPQ